MKLIIRPIWGFISDRIGRRPVMLVSTLGTGLSCVLFGFSKFYWWALIARSLFGALNGNLGVAKTYLREVCDETNQSKAFSIVLNAAFSASLISMWNFNLKFLFFSWSSNWRFFVKTLY